MWDGSSEAHSKAVKYCTPHIGVGIKGGGMFLPDFACVYIQTVAQCS